MTIEKAIEKAARAYNDVELIVIPCPRCEGVGDQQGPGHEPCISCGGARQIEHPTHRIARAIAAFLRAAEATEGMMDAAQAPLRKRWVAPSEVWRAMSSRMADEVEGGHR